MSSPITISLYYNGRQRDYKAIFSDHLPKLEFKVFINDEVVKFEGGLQESFTVKNESRNELPDDAVILAVREQLNQIFF